MISLLVGLALDNTIKCTNNRFLVSRGESNFICTVIHQPTHLVIVCGLGCMERGNYRQWRCSSNNRKQCHNHTWPTVSDVSLLGLELCYTISNSSVAILTLCLVLQAKQWNFWFQEKIEENVLLSYCTTTCKFTIGHRVLLSTVFNLNLSTHVSS